ncbi:MAG TPA: PEGA domain-containing protein, partial [Polyangiaceae bacterium]|nr:PEGA domain-containing protein [Polyangiaceae bacterium]
MSLQDGKNPPNSPGSDLDVFDDLQKKSPSAAGRPRTMIGMPPAPRLPSPPSSAMGRSTVPPPPPPSRAKSAPAPVRSSSGLSSPTARTVPPPAMAPSAPRRSAPPDISSLPPAGVVTARPPGQNLPQVSGDWDDEQEKTTVFDRGTQDAAASLLRSGPSSSPDVPPPPMSRPPAALPTPVRVPAPGPQFSSSQVPTGKIAAAPPASAVQRPVQSVSRAPLYIMAAAVVVLGAVLGLLLRPAKGSLIVTVSGAGNRPIDGVEVLVDSQVVCNASPCRVSDLKAGSHLVQARAAGHSPSSEIAIGIAGGQEAVHNVTLTRLGGTGVKVSAQGAGLKLYVDGNEIGPLPQELSDMTPGQHLIRVAGNDRYAPYEQQINVQVGQEETIGPLSLRVVKGLATIQAGQGASESRVTLESGNDRRTLPTFPIRVDIPTDREHTLVAVRKGYTTYRENLVFEDGQAEKTFVITLTKLGEDAPAEEPASAPAPVAEAPTPKKASAPAPAPAPNPPSTPATPSPAAEAPK